MRKILLLALLSVLILGVGVSVSSAQDNSPVAPMMTSVGPGEGTLNIIAWPGYIEQGDNDPKYDWVTDFEKQTGCTVNAKFADTSDEMVTLMSQGGFDLVTASGDASLRLIYGNQVQQINTDLIPSWSTIDPRLANGAWHTVDKDGDGKVEQYGVPYQWGPNVLMYNTNDFKDKPPTSWDVVFKEQVLPDGKSNKGRVQAYAGSIYIADAALYLKAHNPDLKITDPYELDETQYNAALDLLRQQRTLASNYWSVAGDQVTEFTNEDLAASTSWPYQVNLLKSNGQPIEGVIPEEGSTGWSDTTMMYINAPDPNCAYLWMEHSISPKLQGDLASWFGSVPVVPSACDGNDLLGKDGCKANGIDDFDKISFWKTPIKSCGDDRGDVCIEYSQWVTDFTAIVGGS